MRPDGLNEDEGEIMDLLIKAWNKYIKLEVQHPNETNDFATGIHICQHLLGVRILRRDYPIGWPKK